jgi:Putative polyhydroxyalkanoic acid system protein (PHA_gran_rgn)
MAKPIAVRIPHTLGKDEARRRIAEGFGRLRQQLSGGLAGFIAFEERWEGDRLHFSGGGLGQKITGRIDVFADSVQMQIDLPDMLAAIADRIAGKLQKEGQLLLEKK